MPQRPLPSFITLWERHKQLYLEVFSIALRELSEKDFLSGDEDAISEILRLILNRLGNPTSASWNLNENYVINGIKRFDCKTHEYGKRAPSGMMIGYIISMTPAEIEMEVNGYQKKHLPNCPHITFKSDVKTLFQTHQEIQRRNVEPTQFELIHLWVDLRDKYHKYYLKQKMEKIKGSMTFFWT